MSSRRGRLARVLAPLALSRQHPLLGELSLAGVDVVQHDLEGFARGRRPERLDAHQCRRHATVFVLERRIRGDHVLPTRATVGMTTGRRRSAASRARRKWHGRAWMSCEAEGLDSVRLPHFAGTGRRIESVSRRDGRSLLARLLCLPQTTLVLSNSGSVRFVFVREAFVVPRFSTRLT